MTLIDVIRRTTWGSRYGLGWRPRPLPATTAWLHHTVTANVPATATEWQERNQMQIIDQIGYQRFRYADNFTRWPRPAGAGISYTYVVFPSGRAYQGHDITRASSHTSGYNTHGIGIAVPGNTDIQDLTGAQVDAIARLLVQLKREGALTTARLTGGHKDTGFGTACPGRHAHRRISEINALAARHEAGDAPTTPAPIPTPDPNAGFEPDHIGRIQEMLNRLGSDLDVDKSLGPITTGQVIAYQRAAGLDPDGLPGPKTTTSLEDSMKQLDRIEATLAGHTTDLATLKGRREAPTARDIAAAVWSYVNPDHSDKDMYRFFREAAGRAGINAWSKDDRGEDKEGA